MTRKKEGEHTTSLIKGIRAAGGVAWKIPDPVGCYKTVERPFDVFGGYQGRLLAIECKWMNKPAAFGLRHLAEHQIKALNDCHKIGAKCFVVLFTKFEKRIHMLVYRWETFRKLTKSHSKDSMLTAIGRGASTKKRGNAFSATWLREAFK